MPQRFLISTSFCHASSQFLRVIGLNKAAKPALVPVQAGCVRWEHVQLSCMLLYFSSHPISGLPLSGINRPNKMVFKNRLIASQVYFCNCYMGNKRDEALGRERSMGNLIGLYCPLEEPLGRSTLFFPPTKDDFHLNHKGLRKIIGHGKLSMIDAWIIALSLIFFSIFPLLCFFSFKNNVMWWKLEQLSHMFQWAITPELLYLKHIDILNWITLLRKTGSCLSCFKY